MSTSREGRRAKAATRRSTTLSPLPGRESGAPEPACRLTVSRAALLDDGSDRRFRQLVYDLLTIAVRMEAVREHLPTEWASRLRNTAS